MFKWLRKSILKTSFAEIATPITVQGKDIVILTPKEDRLVVEAYVAATNQLQLKLIMELRSSFKALTNSVGKSPEQEAERITVLNTLKRSYQELFDELDADEEEAGA